MKLIPLAYACLLALFTVPSVTHAADSKKTITHKKLVVAPVAAANIEPEGPELICGQAGNKTLTIPVEYMAAGAIYDADKAGQGCGQSMIIAGVYVNLRDMSPSANMEMPDPESGYLIVGALGSGYELSARKAIDEDILQRSLATAAKEHVYPSMINRSLGKLNDGHYWGHEYFYSRDASGNMTAWKVCKTYRQGDAQETCELIYNDEQRGLSFRVGFKPNVVVDYEYMRAQATQVIDKFLHQA